jgi:hypothetical protein
MTCPRILTGTIPDKYPNNLCLLPDEILQHIFSLLATAPMTTEWMSR